jgi:GNAT superfamily N-acetyltransferase
MPDSEFPCIDDFSADELIRLADEHDDQAFAAIMQNHPAMRQADGCYEMLSGIKHPFANMVFGMNVPNTELRVKSVTMRLQELEAPGYWWVGPCTQPTSLVDILHEHGWVESWLVPALCIDLAELPDNRGPQGVEFLEVTTQADLAAWQEIFAAGNGMPVEVCRLFVPTLGGPVRLYTVLLDGKPVGTTGTFFHREVPGIYCVSTLPEYRGRGIGTAVTALPLMWARAQGFRMGTLQSSKMGYPVYKKLGFQDVCTLRAFAFGMPTEA